MGIKIFVLLSMLFLHVVGDYNLQGILAKMKSKTYYEDSIYESTGLTKHEHMYKSKYKNDYIGG